MQINHQSHRMYTHEQVITHNYVSPTLLVPLTAGPAEWTNLLTFKMSPSSTAASSWCVREEESCQVGGGGREEWREEFKGFKGLKEE